MNKLTLVFLLLFSMSVTVAEKMASQTTELMSKKRNPTVEINELTLDDIGIKYPWIKKVIKLGDEYFEKHRKEYVTMTCRILSDYNERFPDDEAKQRSVFWVDTTYYDVRVVLSPSSNFMIPTFNFDPSLSDKYLYTRYGNHYILFPKNEIIEDLPITDNKIEIEACDVMSDAPTLEFKIVNGKISTANYYKNL